MVDPRGGTWWEVEDVVASHHGPGRRMFLVRYKGFGPAYDEWKAERDSGASPCTSAGESEGLRKRRVLATRPVAEAGPRCESGTPAGVTVTVLGGVLVTISNVKVLGAVQSRTVTVA